MEETGLKPLQTFGILGLNIARKTCPRKILTFPFNGTNAEKLSCKEWEKRLEVINGLLYDIVKKNF